LDEYKKSKVLSNDALSVAVVSQRPSFFTLPWHIKLDIYQKLYGRDLINFHLAFPKSTSELAPFYNLKSNFEYDAYELWPVITLKKTPKPLEEIWIRAAYNLTLRLDASVSWDHFNRISDELRCKLKKLYISGKSKSSRFFFN
jgi:hypothetical protein